MKKGMRFLAVAVLSLAMTTAFGQQSQQDQTGTQGSSGSSGTYQKDKSVQQGQGTKQAKDVDQSQTRPAQPQGQGMGSAEDRIKSEVQWMKTEFNLDAEKEQRLHDLFLKYERQSTTGGDAEKLKEEKTKELKAILGEENYKVYKEKKAEKAKVKPAETTPQK
jgi:hypothetical protein